MSKNYYIDWDIIENSLEKISFNKEKIEGYDIELIKKLFLSFLKDIINTDKEIQKLYSEYVKDNYLKCKASPSNTMPFTVEEKMFTNKTFFAIAKKKDAASQREKIAHVLHYGLGVTASGPINIILSSRKSLQDFAREEGFKGLPVIRSENFLDEYVKKCKKLAFKGGLDYFSVAFNGLKRSIDIVSKEFHGDDLELFKYSCLCYSRGIGIVQSFLYLKLSENSERFENLTFQDLKEVWENNILKMRTIKTNYLAKLHRIEEDSYNEEFEKLQNVKTERIESIITSIDKLEYSKTILEKDEITPENFGFHESLCKRLNSSYNDLKNITGMKDLEDVRKILSVKQGELMLQHTFNTDPAALYGIENSKDAKKIELDSNPELLE